MTPCRHMILAWAGLTLSAGAATNDYALAVATETNVFLGEVFTVDVVVHAPELPVAPAMDPIPGFHVTPLAAVHATSETNTYLYRYAFRPTREGDLTIPALSFRAGTDAIRTQPLPIRARKPSFSDRMTLEVVPSKRSVYQGEPVRLTVTWDSSYPFSALKAVDFHFPILNEPGIQVLDPYEPGKEASDQATGLPVHGTRVLATRKSYEAEGVPHQTLSFSKILIPKQPGELHIPPSTLLCAAVAESQGRPGRRSAFPYPPYFDNTFFDQNASGAEYTRIYTESAPVQLEVIPLPVEGRPELFNGMVGDYTIEVTAEPTDVRIGDPITLTITITAADYMENIFFPPLRYQPLLIHQFEMPSDRSLPERRNRAKIYTQTIRPLSIHATRIPPIQLAYFSPGSRAYVVVESDPIPIRVAPAETITAVGVEGMAIRNRLRAVDQGIRHNYESPDMLISRQRRLLGWAHPAWVLIVLFCPPLLVSGVALRAGFREKQHHIRRTAKAARAYRVYRRNARHIVRQHRTKQAVYSDLDKVLRAYLGDRLHLNPGALTFREVRALLEQAGTDSRTVSDIDNLFQRCESYRFTNGYDEPADAQAIVHQANGVVKAVDRKLR